jgi:alkylhydroperoxidase/carboxymuconolactone decarboxylase family protein YurZ
MSDDHLASPNRDLLLRLAAGDERSLLSILRPTVDPASGEDAAASSGLDRRTRLLVRLGALLALGASTESLRLAVDLASTAGAGDDAVAAVLVATGSAAGSAQLVASASRLAVALDYEPSFPEGEGTALGY